MYTSDFNQYTDKEKEKLKEFKDFCKEKGEQILDTDAELMRFLYLKKFNY